MPQPRSRTGGKNIAQHSLAETVERVRADLAAGYHLNDLGVAGSRAADVDRLVALREQAATNVQLARHAGRMAVARQISALDCAANLEGLADGEDDGMGAILTEAATVLRGLAG